MPCLGRFEPAPMTVSPALPDCMRRMPKSMLPFLRRSLHTCLQHHHMPSHHQIRFQRAMFPTLAMPAWKLNSNGTACVSLKNGEMVVNMAKNGARCTNDSEMDSRK